MKLSPSLAGTITLWLLAVLGTWSFLKDVVPAVARAVRRWQASSSIKSARRQAVDLAISLDKLIELRDPYVFRIYAFFTTNIMILLGILSIMLISIGLFEKEQSTFASAGGLGLVMFATTFVMNQYNRMHLLKNLEITTELARARVQTLGKLYPTDEFLQEFQKKFDELYPKATNLPTDPAKLRALRRSLNIF